MMCSGCRHLVTPGTSISLDGAPDDRGHCPYCLKLLAPADASAEPADDDGDVSVKRFTMRRRVRELFADRLVKLAHDGSPQCPVCGHRLGKSDEILLRNTEYFRCHSCGHDLANLAYRQEAYHEQRWLPVVYVLADLRADEKCAGCRYLGAMARSCQLAFSNMPHAPHKLRGLFPSLLARLEWRTPDDDCLSGCAAVTQYRKTAGAGLILL
jgi:ribosomal protein L37AE/L43A